MARTIEQEASLPKERYYNTSYFSHEQLASFMTQIECVAKCKPDSFLEIGKGNGFVSDYFKKAGVAVTTVDLNPNLEPDICGSILDLDGLVTNSNHDVVLCAEVLEHLPFAEFDNCLQQLANAAKSTVVITLPSCMRSPFDIGMTLKMPFRPRSYKRVFVPILKRKIASDHHWEVGSSKETGFGAIKSRMSKFFKIRKVFRDYTQSYHLFFILDKQPTDS